MFFFFSSRRRHTRCSRDWSSDVCSSDLSATIQDLIHNAESDVVFIGDPRTSVQPGPRMFDRMADVVRESGAGWVYADAVDHARIGYQIGSIRDNFDFGPVLGISVQAAKEV